jgi:hypothetical protein
MHAADMARTRVHYVNGFLLIASLFVGIGAYSELLPRRLAPVPLLTLPTAIVLYGIAWTVRRYPSILNVPKEAYNELPKQDQQKVAACTEPFFYWSVPLWRGFFVVVFGAEGADIPTPAVILITAVIVSIVEGALAIWFLFLQTSQKVSELQEASRSRTD